MPTDGEFVARLMSRGLTRTQANRWRTFASQALDTLEQAADLLATAPRWGALLGKVGERSVDETDITTELFFLFRELQEAAPINSLLRQYAIGCEEPVPARNRAGKRSRDADLVISTLQFRSALRLVLEAKLLRRRSDIKALYLGDDGIGCFTCLDSPYSEAHVAGMAAYVRSRSALEWETDIQVEIEQKIPNTVAEAGTILLPPVRRSFLFSDVPRGDLGIVPLLLLHRAFLFPA